MPSKFSYAAIKKRVKNESVKQCPRCGTKNGTHLGCCLNCDYTWHVVYDNQVEEEDGAEEGEEKSDDRQSVNEYSDEEEEEKEEESDESDYESEELLERGEQKEEDFTSVANANVPPTQQQKVAMDIMRFAECGRQTAVNDLGDDTDDEFESDAEEERGTDGSAGISSLYFSKNMKSKSLGITKGSGSGTRRSDILRTFKVGSRAPTKATLQTRVVFAGSKARTEEMNEEKARVIKKAYKEVLKNCGRDNLSDPNEIDPFMVKMHCKVLLLKHGFTMGEKGGGKAPKYASTVEKIMEAKNCCINTKADFTKENLELVKQWATNKVNNNPKITPSSKPGSIRGYTNAFLAYVEVLKLEKNGTLNALQYGVVED